MNLRQNYRVRYIALPLISATLALGACSSDPHTGKGAAAGAILGGAVGAAAGGWKGAAIGAAAGGASGAGIGAYLDHRQRELQQVVQTQKTENGLLVTLKNDILFDTNKTELKPEADQTLTQLAAILKKYPKDRLQVRGYTDDVGTAAYNKKLSERRAESVKSFLASNGVNDTQVTAVGEGEIASAEKSATARQANRKVQIFIDPELPQQEQKAKSASAG